MSLIERPDDPEEKALEALEALREMVGDNYPATRAELTYAGTAAITHALLEVAAAMRETAP